jgi:hypothetical protein
MIRCYRADGTLLVVAGKRYASERVRDDGVSSATSTPEHIVLYYSSFSEPPAALAFQRRGQYNRACVICPSKIG